MWMEHIQWLDDRLHRTALKYKSQGWRKWDVQGNDEVINEIGTCSNAYLLYDVQKQMIKGLWLWLWMVGGKEVVMT
jgi:hypothetical protein